ncbi:TPA: hypothetical protein DIC40_00145 [Patescibacteria group bacterium]|nr:hypothetical protein P148_SR1C00001G0915 [candidate division SR1 bacterium RAAC1_SR1_1]HCY20288.1 hypothetical protein [Candidatus Gracilibacteria bacterium]
METKSCALVLVFSVDDMPKSQEKIYKKAFFSTFKDDKLRQIFDKLTSDYPECSFIIYPYDIQERNAVVNKVLLKKRIPSAFIYENIDGKDVASLIKGDASFLKYFE